MKKKTIKKTTVRPHFSYSSLFFGFYRKTVFILTFSLISRENMNSIIDKILPQIKEVAVVGLSTNKARDAYHVSEYLVEKGRKVYPINPENFEFCGQKSFPSLTEIPEEIQQSLDTIVVFRRSDAVPAIVEEILKMKTKPKFLWLQEGVIHEHSTNIAKNNGIECVVNRYNSSFFSSFKFFLLAFSPDSIFIRCILKEIMKRDDKKQ